MKTLQNLFVLSIATFGFLFVTACTDKKVEIPKDTLNSSLNDQTRSKNSGPMGGMLTAKAEMTDYECKGSDDITCTVTKGSFTAETDSEMAAGTFRTIYLEGMAGAGAIKVKKDEVVNVKGTVKLKKKDTYLEVVDSSFEKI